LLRLSNNLITMLRLVLALFCAALVLAGEIKSDNYGVEEYDTTNYGYDGKSNAYDGNKYGGYVGSNNYDYDSTNYGNAKGYGKAYDSNSYGYDSKDYGYGKGYGKSYESKDYDYGKSYGKSYDSNSYGYNGKSYGHGKKPHHRHAKKEQYGGY
jgi:hypothetical protein